MRDDKTAVPKPGEAGRGDDKIHYHQVDETNVGDADRSEKAQADAPRRPDAGES